MTLRLAVCPSWEDGFGVEIVEQRSASVVQPSSASYVIRTKGLSGSSIVSAAELAALFSPLRTSQILTADDAAPIPELVRSVRVGIPTQEWVTCDDTPISLSIECGDLYLALQWNSEPPAEWHGINELVAHLSALYPLYRHQKTNDRNG